MCKKRKQDKEIENCKKHSVAYILTVMKVFLYIFTKLMQQNKYFSYVGYFAFPQNFHTRKLDQISVFSNLGDLKLLKQSIEIF